MMNIAIGCNFYLCYPELERLLQSIPKDFIKYFIAVDGCYKYIKEKYPNSPNKSDDGSVNLILQHSIHKFIPILINKTNCTEFEKRNTYLEICEKLNDDIDVLIIVDSDEMLLFPNNITTDEAVEYFKYNLEKIIIKKHEGKHNVFLMHGLNMNTDPPYDCMYPRIWYKPGEMRYINGSHYYYANIYKEKKEIEQFNKQRYNYVQYASDVIKGVVLGHSHSLRSKEFMKQREDYIEYLKRFEGLTQSHYFSLDESHRLAVLGVSRDQININNKDEILRSSKQNNTRISIRET